MDPTDLVPGYGYPPTPEEQEDLLIIGRELLRAVPTFLPERRLWAEEKLADVERQLDGREGSPAGSARRKKIEETISKVRGDTYDGQNAELSIPPTRRRKRAKDQPTSTLVRRLRYSEPGDGNYSFPRSLAHTIEPRAPIGKLGFTKS
jgi:hypothetical protein